MYNDYPNYLMHKSHKYIDRKWVKNKWQYIYDEKLGGKEKKAYEQAKTREQNAIVTYRVRRNTSKAAKAEREMNNAIANRDVLEARYKETAIGMIDSAKAKGKALADKIFAKSIAKKDAKKQAEYKQKREQGYADEQRIKATNAAAQHPDSRRTELERKQKEMAKAARDDMPRSSKERREHGYAVDAKAKTEAQAAHKKKVETEIRTTFEDKTLEMRTEYGDKKKNLDRIKNDKGQLKKEADESKQKYEAANKKYWYLIDKYCDNVSHAEDNIIEYSIKPAYAKDKDLVALFNKAYTEAMNANLEYGIKQDMAYQAERRKTGQSYSGDMSGFQMIDPYPKISVDKQGRLEVWGHVKDLYPMIELHSPAPTPSHLGTQTSPSGSAKRPRSRKKHIE